MNRLIFGLVIIILLSVIVSAQQPVKAGAISFVWPKGSMDVTNVKSLISGIVVNKHSIIFSEGRINAGKLYKMDNIFLAIAPSSSKAEIEKDY